MFGWMIEVNNVLINGGEKAIYTLSENNFWLFNHKMLFVALTLPLTVSWFPRPVLDLPVSITRCPDSSLVDIIIHHHHHHPSLPSQVDINIHPSTSLLCNCCREGDLEESQDDHLVPEQCKQCSLHSWMILSKAFLNFEVCSFSWLRSFFTWWNAVTVFFPISSQISGWLLKRFRICRLFPPYRYWQPSCRL